MSVRASVAMAVYQGEKYLPQQLSSILEQMADNDELVISYDASTDGTLPLIRGWAAKDRRIRIVEDPGAGVIDNFNSALSHSDGRWLFIADQDDIWLPGKIDGMIELLKNSGAALAVHNGIPIDEEGKILGDDFFAAERIGPSFWRNFLKSRYSGCCMAFTREFAAAALPIPKGIDAYDRWLALLAERYFTIAFTDEIWIHHRLHGDNVTPEQSRSSGVILKTRWNMGKALLKKGRLLKRG